MQKGYVQSCFVVGGATHGEISGRAALPVFCATGASVALFKATGLMSMSTAIREAVSLVRHV
jgi:spore maturation protein SpmB